VRVRAGPQISRGDGRRDNVRLHAGTPSSDFQTEIDSSWSRPAIYLRPATESFRCPPPDLPFGRSDSPQPRWLQRTISAKIPNKLADCCVTSYRETSTVSASHPRSANPTRASFVFYREAAINERADIEAAVEKIV